MKHTGRTMPDRRLSGLHQATMKPKEGDDSKTKPDPGQHHLSKLPLRLYPKLRV